MDDRVERRRPDRHQFALRLLRRLAILLLVVAVALWGLPRLLVEFGVLGPTAEDRIGEARRAIATARAYGAVDALAPLKAAEDGVARAGTLVQQGKEREARRAAVEATASAIEAQKMALVAQTQVREKAEAVYNDLDRQINDLEKLYDAVVPGLEKQRTAELLTLMKVTRQSTGVLFLAYEKQDFAAVVEGEPRARQAVDSARKTLESARRR
jgi:hypothetical protein